MFCINDKCFGLNFGYRFLFDSTKQRNQKYYGLNWSNSNPIQVKYNFIVSHKISNNTEMEDSSHAIFSFVTLPLQR